jgi:hypothetical protein
MGIGCIQGSLSEVILSVFVLNVWWYAGDGIPVVSCFFGLVHCPVACDPSARAWQLETTRPTSLPRQDPRAALPSRGEVGVFIR